MFALTVFYLFKFNWKNGAFAPECCMALSVPDTIFIMYYKRYTSCFKNILN